MNNGMNVATAQRDDWRTPEILFNWLDRRFHFTIDAAADSENTKVVRFWNEWEDGLEQSWRGERVFCNPPFSRKHQFTQKAAAGDADIAVLVLPSTPEQVWYHEWVIGARARILVPRGRIKFNPPPGVTATSPRFASIIAVYTRVAPIECVVESIDLRGASYAA